MLSWFRYILLFSIALFSSFRVAAQVAMPDNVSAGTVKHYYVDPNPVPGSSYTWKINGVIQVSSATNEIDITWITSGTYLLEVQELSADGCPGPLRSGQVFVTAPPILVDSADLSIVETVNNTHPIIGSTVLFTISATNNGSDNATGVTVSGVLQSGYTYVSSTTITGTYDPSTGVWTIGNLPAGESGSLIITVTVNSTGYYFNTVTIQGNEPDGNLINNVTVAGTYPTDFFIPEGFSPNNDGINDLFVIRGIGSFTDNSIMIFNRWGNKVFEASPYQNTWDGRSSKGLRIGGDELPAGTYFYLLDLGDGSEVIKGTIYLNR
jgi:gliding motility-associated-like protein/uncharacterized repeat protein (TIGR01451 family)